MVGSLYAYMINHHIYPIRSLTMYCIWTVVNYKIGDPIYWQVYKVPLSTPIGGHPPPSLSIRQINHSPPNYTIGGEEARGREMQGRKQFFQLQKLLFGFLAIRLIEVLSESLIS